MCGAINAGDMQRLVPKPSQTVLTIGLRRSGGKSQQKNQPIGKPVHKKTGLRAQAGFVFL